MGIDWHFLYFTVCIALHSFVGIIFLKIYNFKIGKIITVKEDNIYRPFCSLLIVKQIKKPKVKKTSNNMLDV